MLRDQEKILRDQETRDLVAWLFPLNFQAKQHDIFSRRQEGTGQWLLEDDVFKEWLDGSRKILWCPGIRRSPSLMYFRAIAN
jgi:hypothetical protein